MKKRPCFLFVAVFVELICVPQLWAASLDGILNALDVLMITR